MPTQAEVARILSGIFPPEAILTSREDLVPYSFDGTAALQQMPAVVVIAQTVDEVSRLLTAANQSGLIIVPRGSGTGLSGGSIPLEGSVVLCLTRMNRVLEVDARNLTLLAEAGATTLAIAEAAAQSRPFLSSGSGLHEDFDDRRQRRRKLGRAARAEVRRHARLRDGARGRAS